MKTIELYNSPKGWMSKHSDPVVRDLMGTDIVPCAFTSRASAESVLKKMKELNPDRRVFLGYDRSLVVRGFGS